MNHKCTTVLQKKIINILKRTHKWKSPGIDKITNFWRNQPSSTNVDNYLENNFKKLKKMSDWLTEGVNTNSRKQRKQQIQKKLPINNIK